MACFVTDTSTAMYDVQEFAKTLEEQEQMMNKTVLHSLLAVDDFLQFKNLMIQRNLYLQNQVAKHLEAIAAEEAEVSRERGGRREERGGE